MATGWASVGSLLCSDSVHHGFNTALFACTETLARFSDGLEGRRTPQSLQRQPYKATIHALTVANSTQVLRRHRPRRLDHVISWYPSNTSRCAKQPRYIIWER